MKQTQQSPLSRLRVTYLPIVTNTDTETKSKIEDFEHRKVVSWTYDMEGFAWNVKANWRTNPWICDQKFQHPVWMILNSRKMISESWVSWPMYVVLVFLMLKLWSTRHFYGQSSIGSSCHEMEQIV